MKKIVISGLWNYTISSLGAQALSEGITSKIEKLFGSNDIHILSNINLFKGSKRICLAVNKIPFLYPILEKIYFSFYKKKYSDRIKIIQNSEILIINGDGIIADIFAYNTFMLALDIRVAIENNIPFVSLNQSINISKGTLAEYFVKKCFIKSDISVREIKSKSILKELYGLDANVSIDSAFLVEPLRKSESEIFEIYLNKLKEKYQFKKYIVIGIRGNRPSGQSINLSSWNKIINYIKEKLPNIDIIFASTCVEYDIQLAKNLVKRNADIIVINELLDWGKYNYRFFLYLLKNAEFGISDRYHQNVFSYLVQLPFIPVEGNTSKSTGLTALLNYPIDVLELPTESNFNIYMNSINKIIDENSQIKDSMKTNKITSNDNYDRFLVKHLS